MRRSASRTRRALRSVASARTSRSGATAGSVLMIPMQFGPIMRMPAARTLPRISSSRTRPPVPGFAESGTDDDEGLDAFRDAIVDDRAHRGARHANHRQIDLAWNSGHRRKCRDSRRSDEACGMDDE